MIENYLWIYTIIEKIDDPFDSSEENTQKILNNNKKKSIHFKMGKKSIANKW